MLIAPTLPRGPVPQTDRAEITKLVEQGEELISRFRHWEPLLRECQQQGPPAIVLQATLCAHLYSFSHYQMHVVKVAG